MRHLNSFVLNENTFRIHLLGCKNNQFYGYKHSFLYTEYSLFNDKIILDSKSVPFELVRDNSTGIILLFTLYSKILENFARYLTEK